MRAYVYGEGGAAIVDIAQPQPGPGQVLVKIHAACLNRADLGMIAGHVHGARGGPGTVLGIEWAGEVVGLGAGVTRRKIGDRIMGSGSGGFADYCTPDEGRALPVPDTMSFEDAASLPVAITTMHDAIVSNGELRTGQAVLIQGASSGVGLMGLKIAKLMGAGLVAGSSTDAGRRAKLADFGADLALDTSDPAWVQQALDATGGEGVDLIVDQVSGKLANQSLAATRIKGRIVNVGRLGGAMEAFNFDLHALRRIRYIGVTFRTRTKEEVRDIFAAAQADLGAAIADRHLDLPIDSVFDLADIAQASARMATNKHFGKIVIRL